MATDCQTKKQARCAIYEGCQGHGWLWDSEDSGSGAQVYCTCPAGDELKQLDKAQRQAERDAGVR